MAALGAAEVLLALCCAGLWAVAARRGAIGVRTQEAPGNPRLAAPPTSHYLACSGGTLFRDSDRRDRGEAQLGPGSCGLLLLRPAPASPGPVVPLEPHVANLGGHVRDQDGVQVPRAANPRHLQLDDGRVAAPTGLAAAAQETGGLAKQRPSMARAGTSTTV